MNARAGLTRDNNPDAGVAGMGWRLQGLHPGPQPESVRENHTAYGSIIFMCFAGKFKVILLKAGSG